MKGIALAVLSLLASHAVVSPPPDGSELLRACTATVVQADGGQLTVEQSVQSIWCSGYVGGFLDGLAVMGWKGGSAKVCLPREGIENDQAIRIIVKYLRDNPAMLHQSGRVLIVVAIAEAFRCK
jgi:hypothetical protein